MADFWAWLWDWIYNTFGIANLMALINGEVSFGNK
jgi:hypothetical protein